MPSSGSRGDEEFVVSDPVRPHGHYVLERVQFGRRRTETKIDIEIIANLLLGEIVLRLSAVGQKRLRERGTIVGKVSFLAD
jgi:hypothetical protein